MGYLVEEICKRAESVNLGKPRINLNQLLFTRSIARLCNTRDLISQYKVSGKTRRNVGTICKM